MRIKTILFLILSILSANAQTTQPGLVQEYNEKAKKTPLAGVEVRAKSANSAASGKDGKFELQFLTLNPGDRVNVSRIEKLRYEIFNKEAVEQWNINPKTPFVVVMCKSDKFKKIRDNYEAKASENYSKQYKKEIANLNKLKEEGKIIDEEYRKSLQEIQATYDKQLENLENYVDRFARIDLSEISSLEQEIIELVQQGRFDEAIAKYDELDIKNKLTQQINNRNAVREAKSTLDEIESQQTESIDSMYAMADRQIELLKLAGGKENNLKIKDIYLNIADADTTNIEWLNKTGLFISNYLADYNLALEYHQKALNSAIDNRGTDDYSVAKCYNNIGGIWGKVNDYRKALEYYNKALAIQKKIFGIDHPANSACYNNIGNIYKSLGDYTAALNYYKKSVIAYKKVMSDNCPEIAQTYNNIGTTYLSMGDYDTSLQWLQKSLKIRENVLDIEHPDVAETYNNIRTVYLYKHEYLIAYDWLTKALNIRKKVYGIDHPSVGNTYNNIGGVYVSQGKYTDALDCFYKSLEIKEKVFRFEHNLTAETLGNIGFVYLSQGNYAKALDYYNRALIIKEKIFGLDHPKVISSKKEIEELTNKLAEQTNDNQ